MANDTLYKSIYKELKKKIIDGVYKIDDCLPSEEVLTKQYFTSRITIKKAMELLVNEGYIVRHPGRGTYVSDKYKENAIENRLNLVGLILSNISSAFGLEILLSIEQELSNLGYNVIIKNSKGDIALETKYINELITIGCKGLIIQPVHNEYYNEKLIFHHINKFPIVLIDRDFSGMQLHCIRTDNFSAALDATKLLFEKGHEKIAFFCSKDSDVSSIENRKNGFQSAYFYNQKFLKGTYVANILSSPNSPFDKEVFNNDVKLVINFLEEEKDITCLFASEFAVCKILYEAIRKMGKSIPNDYSLITFDYGYGLVNPDVARIMQDQTEMGRIAVSVLHKLINHEDVAVKLFSPYKIYPGKTLKVIK